MDTGSGRVPVLTCSAGCSPLQSMLWRPVGLALPPSSAAFAVDLRLRPPCVGGVAPPPCALPLPERFAALPAS